MAVVDDRLETAFEEGLSYAGRDAVSGKLVKSIVQNVGILVIAGGQGEAGTAGQRAAPLEGSIEVRIVESRVSIEGELVTRLVAISLYGVTVIDLMGQ